MATKKPSVEKAKIPPLRYEYLCPACSNVAIKTSDKMIGPMVDCAKCGKLIKLEDKKRYKKLKKEIKR